MKKLVLYRLIPGPDDSPTGTVADAVVFPDGTAVLHWRTQPASTEIYPDEAAMRAVRESSGRSEFRRGW